MVTPIRAPLVSPAEAVLSAVFWLEPQAARAAVRTTAEATAPIRENLIALNSFIGGSGVASSVNANNGPVNCSRNLTDMLKKLVSQTLPDAAEAKLLSITDGGQGLRQPKRARRNPSCIRVTPTGRLHQAPGPLLDGA